MQNPSPNEHQRNFQRMLKARQGNDIPALRALSATVARWSSSYQTQLLRTLAAKATVEQAEALRDAPWKTKWEDRMFISAAAHGNMPLVEHLAPKLPTKHPQALAAAAAQGSTKCLEVVRLLGPGLAATNPQAVASAACVVLDGPGLTTKNLRAQTLHYLLSLVPAERVIMCTVSGSQDDTASARLESLEQFLAKHLRDDAFRAHQLGMPAPSGDIWRGKARAMAPTLMAQMDVLRLQDHAPEAHAPRRMMRL